MRPMSEPADLNPYAPPRADPDGLSQRARAARGRQGAAVREALARLDEHLADPARVAADRAAAGGRVRTVTIVFSALALVAVAVMAYAFTGYGAAGPVALLFALVFSVLAIALIVLDLSLVEHGTASAPEAALRSYLKSLAMARVGYAWAALCPTAREQRVRTPALGEVVVAAGEHSMSSSESVKKYVQSFARPGGDQMRNMRVKRVTIADVQEDVAVIEAVLAFQSWPRWVSIVMIVGFILFRPAILIGVVLFFVMRKQFEVRVTKTLIRGRNGAWYVLDADILEGAAAS